MIEFMVKLESGEYVHLRTPSLEKVFEVLSPDMPVFQLHEEHFVRTKSRRICVAVFNVN